jgi:alginate O-acetyltransferase complex protein AlgI
MLFNSFSFLIFFILVTAAFFAMPYRYRWLVLLVASCIFYMYFIPIYILILFFTIIIDYIAGILIETSTGRKRKILLVLSIVSNVGVLAVFKYYNFFVANINSLNHYWNISSANLSFLKIILPIGLSFHTFQAMSYTIEVYRGNQKAERHFGIYSLYVMFYPQLVAGPIERPQNILHQFHQKQEFSYANLQSGLKYILWGLFKKVVIADRLAIVVGAVYDHPAEWQGFSLLVATVFFAIQIYCDFSGYSDIAVGCARVMGFKLMKNFEQPYFSPSISKFWTRWHISLSTWFRDYLYIPIGGNRVSVPRWYFNLLFVFIVSGFWHGANWTFIIWGFLHGIFLVLENIQKRYLPQLKLASFLAVVITFSLVCFSWIFFRAKNIQDAMYIVTHLFSGDSLKNYFRLSQASIHGLSDSYFGLPLYKFAFSVSLIFLLFLFDWVIVNKKFYQTPIIFQWLVYYFLIGGIIFLGVFETNQFIYFQF